MSLPFRFSLSSISFSDLATNALYERAKQLQKRVNSVCFCLRSVEIATLLKDSTSAECPIKKRNEISGVGCSLLSSEKNL